ncbi:hypothetical protein [Rhodococcus qingshengii]|uniref:hypothetical protein n=1 Tax=Rhodococcus qingshengii TaxID=334542 RepID=UPI003015DEF9
MDKFLRIYLNDQLALGLLWRELARRAQRKNNGTDLGEALTCVCAGITEDVATFRRLMGALGMPANPVKLALVVAAERVGRLKLNGRLRGYSPLSRFIEVEFLVMGIEGKKQLWTTLRDIAELETRLPNIDFEELIARAERQREELEPFRTRTGKEAFIASPTRTMTSRPLAGGQRSLGQTEIGFGVRCSRPCVHHTLGRRLRRLFRRTECAVVVHVHKVFRTVLIGPHERPRSPPCAGREK